MSKRIIKYNPAFLSNEELVRSFVVRHAELELIEQVIRENVTKSNQHVLVIGPRGIGKTMLVLRVVEDVRTKKDMSKRWYPLVFSEESYQVTTPGEFWLEALFHLGQKTGEACWKQTYRELSSEQDESRLRERALGQLMDFADTQGKRILLVVENLNMLLGEQLSDSDGWALRHTLLNEPRVMLLATATSRFEEIDNCGKPMFELFRALELEPLDEEECQILWNSITGKESTDERVRPLQILTGGSPRLLAIVSTFAVRMSLKELMDDLMQLVDDHTEYFKNHLDKLPAVERKAYLALAELWDPATAREVADVARLNINKTSSLLRRLMERGAVVLADGRKRTKLYQVAERMYNIYYLMRRRGAPSRRVKAVVRFMVNFYGQEELVKLTQRIAEEAYKLKPEFRKDHFFAYEALLETTSIQSLREKLIKAPPHDFFEMPDIPASIKKLVEPKKPKDLREAEADEDLLKLLKQAEDLKKEGKLEEAERVYRKAIEIAPKSAKAQAELGDFLHENLKEYDKAEEAFRKAIELDEKYALPWAGLGFLLHVNLERYEEAEKAYRKAIELDEKYAFAWAHLGELLHEKLERYDEAERAYRNAIKMEPEVSWGHAKLGLLLHEKLERYEEAEKAYRKAIELDEKYAWAWAQLGELLDEKLERYDEAETAYRKAIEIEPKVVWGHGRLGLLLHEKLGRYEESETAYRKAIEIEPKAAWVHAHLAKLLYEKLEFYEESEREFRKAIELDEKYAWAWAQLGELLDEKLERYDEAEKAYQEVIEMKPKAAWGHAKLGELLHEKLERYDEAEKAYRKAIETEPEVAWGHAKLGHLLHEKLERYDEAEKAYHKALEIDDKYDLCWALLGQLLHEKLERYDEAEKAYRKALDIDEKFVWAWAHLALLLQYKLNRYEEAEELYRKAIKIAPKNPGLWAALGLLLHVNLKRYDEAENAYRKAIELDEQFVRTWEALGMLLEEELGQYEEAIKAYRKAMEIEPEDHSVLIKLVTLLLDKVGQPTDALRLAEGHLAKHPKEAGLRNTLAWRFYKYGPQSFLIQAEAWTREALAMEPNNPRFQHTLASILCSLGKETEAIELARRYIEDKEVVEKTVDNAIDLFVGLAAVSCGQEALEILQESPSSKILEPLVVGLQLFVGEDVKAAAEIMEVARDVVKQIEERRDKMQSKPRVKRGGKHKRKPAE